MTKTKIIRDVAQRDLPLVEGGLRADGYLVHTEPQADGRFTVIGIKQVSGVPQAITSDAARRGPGAGSGAMAKTKIITDVPAADVPMVEAGLRADGYSTARHAQPDGRFTIIGIKQVLSVAAAVDSTPGSGGAAGPATEPAVRSTRRRKRG